MAIIVDFIKNYSPWVYGACALIALWYLRVAFVARRDRRHAVFTLEREAAMNRIYGAWTVAIGLLVVMGLVYLLSTVVSDAVAPLVQEAKQPSTPQVVVMDNLTPSPTLPIPEVTPTLSPTPRPRPTRRPEPTPAPTPTANKPAIQSPRCPDARAVITSPGLDAEVSGMVPVVGTATHEGFVYYKLEWGPGPSPADNQWSYFDGGEAPVQGGQLGTLNAGALAPGTYTLRLVVVDNTGNYGAQPCQTRVVIR
jgi:hypothetical protein